MKAPAAALAGDLSFLWPWWLYSGPQGRRRSISTSLRLFVPNPGPCEMSVGGIWPIWIQFLSEYPAKQRQAALARPKRCGRLLPRCLTTPRLNRTGRQCWAVATGSELSNQMLQLVLRGWQGHMDGDQDARELGQVGQSAERGCLEREELLPPEDAVLRGVRSDVLFSCCATYVSLLMLLGPEHLYLSNGANRPRKYRAEPKQAFWFYLTSFSSQEPVLPFLNMCFCWGLPLTAVIGLKMGM